jgi:hypothetical protein
MKHTSAMKTTPTPTIASLNSASIASVRNANGFSDE